MDRSQTHPADGACRLFVANDDQNAEDVQAAVSDDPMIRQALVPATMCCPCFSCACGLEFRF